MLKQIMIALIALTLINSQAYAQKTIKLDPKESKSLTNTMLWTLKANCSIQGKKSTQKILVRVLENKGEVNGKHLSKGQTTSVTLNNNDNISVSAEPGTIVNIINLGNDPVQAVCSS